MGTLGRRLREWLLAGVAALSCATASGVRAEPGFPAAPRPPAGAPNVLVIMTDDVGFAASSTFGGEIPTPTLDALAANGLAYTNVFTTALCSPTRAALLTGRNAHAVGFGTVPELAMGDAGYNSLIPRSAGSLAQILSTAGYDTAMVGKSHNVPTWQSGSLGPFDQWASGLGFNYFYGFHGGFTDQFHPSLIENTRMVEQPAEANGRESGYILDRDLADHAIGWLRTQQAQHPDRRFLLYYAPGTAHAPLQAPAEWIARFKGKFDAGWDAYRQATLARQKRMGIVPMDTRLAPLPAEVRPWSQLSSDERKVAARYMETYAAQLAYCDAQIGRIIAELKRSGQFDNTLVIFMEGDNGASGEGGELGALDYITRMSGGYTKAQEAEHSLAHIDDIGGPRSYAIGPSGWAAAMNTPFPYYKVVASRLGGVRNGMVVAWPARLKQRGVRRQFVHVTDIAPTILDAAGVQPPASLDGVAQAPFDGVSFAESFAKADAPSRHRVQYFEVFGHAAIYKDGWLLAERVSTDSARGAAVPEPSSPWELYDLTTDFAQTEDVAAAHPEKVAELKAVWQAEATRNQVLPLVANNLPAMLPGVRPEPASEAGRHEFRRTDDRYPEGVFPTINNRSWSIEAEIEAPAAGAEGVIVTQGGRASGWALAVLDGAPTFLYRLNDRPETLSRLAAGAPLTPGRHKVTVSFRVDGPGFGRGGAVAMQIDGKRVAEGRLERTAPFKFATEDAVIGRDVGTAVVDDYRPPFAFTGAIEQVAIDLGPVQPMQPKPAQAASTSPSLTTARR
jgi:arylsulfatase